MKFFDAKEEVMDIKLTQYGKHLLSKGKFSPKYYAFYDDDIVYDIAWSKSDLTENQNLIKDRIQDETPRIRTQHCFHGVETEIKKTVEMVRQKKAKLGDDLTQASPAKHYALPLPLGNSSLKTDKLPAWQASFLHGRLSGSVDHMTGSSPNFKIPQLSCEVKYKVRAFAEGEEVPMPDSARQAISEVGGDQDHVGQWGGEYEFEDGSTLQVFNDYLLLEIEEANTDYLEENFDIEVYEIKTVPASGSQSPGEGKGEIEQLIPLHFARTEQNLGELYLLNAPDGSAQNVDTVFPDVDPSYVEYFFDISVDREIDQSVICENLPEDRTRHMRLQREFKCPDRTKSLLDTTDLYDSEQSDVEDFEECD